MCVKEVVYARTIEKAACKVNDEKSAGESLVSPFILPRFTASRKTENVTIEAPQPWITHCDV